MDKRNDKRNIISDCLMVSGGVLLSIGAGMICAAAGVIVAGVITIVYGICIGRGGEQE